ncbi:stage II sporulation protein M [Flavisolibacter ginsenosidimutans]|uniref:stage II sporulation protein M n=1 Tax=Flavisolibacter ginsenosidimutans TaxID=661481 RepID=UPI001D1425EB|nr:stage II sporulation protein M [Flavisolibacter ginsenosidimutans]
MQLVDDLSYAKTYYPTSRVTKYINGLASKIYLGIYQNRKEESNRLLRFWKYDVPLTVYKHGRIILFSFFVFFLFYTVGFFTAKHDPTFVRDVFGNDYVDKTEHNIASGNPFGIYQQGDSFFMWIAIMINNIIVSFKYFGEGLLLGIFSLKALAQESMRVGVFNYMFFDKGMGAKFVLAVMIHGLLELTAIVMSCGAGAVMGTSYLFPGTRSRLDAFKEGVKDGVKIVIGLVPVLMLAAFYEGFVTRYYTMPLLPNLLILASSAAFIIFYFVVYPILLKRKERSVHA